MHEYNAWAAGNRGPRFMKITSKKHLYSVLLLLTALIWGVAFVAQSEGMKYIEPFTFSGIRSVLGGLVLLPVIAVLDKNKKTKGIPPVGTKKNLLIGGGLCGILLFIATNIQQFGIKYTTVGKAGFITACYIVLVPIFGLFIGRKCKATVWVSVALAVVGLYLLCISGATTINIGDVIMFGAAIGFAIQILLVDHYAPITDCLKLACVEFLVCGVLSLLAMAIFETPELASIWAARVPILYAGIMSCGVAYTLQMVAQKEVNPSVASLLMSMEAVFSVMAAWVIIGQTMSIRELLGCGIMFGAVILAQK